jgi:hypothetical protein
MKLLILLLLLCTSCASNSFNTSDRTIASLNETQCSQIVKQFFPASNHNVAVSSQDFLRYYDDLNDTLSGNLATVFRSEWKAKEDYQQGATYLSDILIKFDAESLVKKNAKFSGKQFISRVVDHMREIEKIGKVSMRDPPPPIGSFDRTFTYYTKALTDGTGAKHQIRLRSYLRELVPNEMLTNIPVKGFYNGRYIEIISTGHGQFKLITAPGFSSEKKEYIGDVTEKVLSLDQLKKEINNELTFYAYPHAKGFKLEIKTRPHDEVNHQDYEKLLGKNYVQKLSIDIDSADISLLFKDKHIKNAEDMQTKLVLLKEKASKNSKNSTDRINAIFNLLFDANELDSDFFVARGATEYRRYALELEVPDLIDGEKVRIQTTFDYDMSVRHNYDTNGNFLDPFQSLANPVQKPFNKDEDLHIELKVPKALVERAVNEKVSDSFLELMKIFNSHQVTNKGKFKHIMNQDDILE